MYLNGMKIVESPYHVNHHIAQRKKHKKRRINKKWAKKYGFHSFTTPKKEVFILYGNTLVGHPTIIKQLMEGAR